MFCDESNTEETLTLDNEYINFLEQDLNYLENGTLSGSVMEVTIDPPCTIPSLPHREIESRDQFSTSSLSAPPDTKIKWSKLSLTRQKSITKNFEEI